MSLFKKKQDINRLWQMANRFAVAVYEVLTGEPAYSLDKFKISIAPTRGYVPKNVWKKVDVYIRRRDGEEVTFSFRLMYDEYWNDWTPYSSSFVCVSGTMYWTMNGGGEANFGLWSSGSPSWKMDPVFIYMHEEVWRGSSYMDRHQKPSKPEHPSSEKHGLPFEQTELAAAFS